MAELAKARSMQSYYNIIQDYIAAKCEKLAQGFYTAATWRGIEPRTCDTLVRRSTSKPPSHQFLLCFMCFYFCVSLLNILSSFTVFTSFYAKATKRLQ